MFSSTKLLLPQEQFMTFLFVLVVFWLVGHQIKLTASLAKYQQSPATTKNWFQVDSSAGIFTEANLETKVKNHICPV